MKKGDLAGGVNNYGYLKTGINGKMYPNHRLMWLLIHGEWPDGEIDHINGNPSDNRIENLRLVSHEENTRNMKLHKNNQSGVPGVIWHKVADKWAAYIGVDGKKKYLGVFDDWFDAVCARKSAENKYGFHENHGRVACVT